MFKKFISVVLSLVMISCYVTISFAGEVQASLRSVYGDGMLFKQNEEAVFVGTAPSGSTVKAELYDSENSLVCEGSAQASSDGAFSVSFIAPAGSFEEYTVILTAGLREFARLENVVFGELWLASGQSNMMYPLAQEKTGREMQAQGKKLSKWLRVLLEPAYPEYNGSAELIPLEPQNDIKDARWVTGEDDEIYGMSAVAYFFAESMLEKLNMPVGILNSSLGGTTIASWLSRDAIDGCPEVKDILTAKGRYIEKAQWDEAEQNIYHDMTTNFNLRTNALKNFKLSGMIWYQGESDLMLGYTAEEYTVQLELLQKFYTEHFGYKDGLLPLVYTQLASYMYSDKGYELLDWNIEYSEFCREAPDSRAVVAIYDVPSTFTKAVGAIHPECKKEIGQRMAFTADGLVYSGFEGHCAPYPVSSETVDSSVFVTFGNVGDGLKADGDVLYGFTVCDSHGIYVPANAEIVGKDTVRIYCDSIASPVSATYAYCVGNYRSNLYATKDGELTLPSSPFVTGRVDEAHYWADKAWTDCEDATLWHNYSDEYGAYYKAWNGENAKVKLSNADAYSGEKGLNITSDSASFSVMPVLTYKKDTATVSFDEADENYSDYGAMSFFVRNNGIRDVTLDNVRFYKNALAYYVSDDFEATVIPADGQWHRVEVKLDTISVGGDKTGKTFSNSVLDEVKDIKFAFSSDGEADISMDHIRFEAEAAEKENTASCFKLLEKMNLFTTFIISLITRITG